MTETTFDSPKHLADHLRFLSQNKGGVLLIVAVVVASTLVKSMLAAPVYRASATLLIENEQKSSPLTGERLNYESYVSENLTFKTHFKLIASRPVLERVVDGLRPEEIPKIPEPGFLESLKDRIKTNIRLLLRRRDKIATPMQKRALMVKALRDKIAVKEVPGTRLLVVSVEDEDAVMAQRLANSLTESYIAFDRAIRLRSSQNTLGWMSDQLYEMKKKIEDSETEFLAFKEKEKLFSISGKQKVISQNIEDLNEEYLKTKNQRMEIDAKVARLKGPVRTKGIDDNARSLLDNPLVDNLYTQMLAAEVELTKLGKVFKGKHPKIVQAKGTLDQLREKLRYELDKEIEGLETRRSVLIEKEKGLDATISDFENDALNTNKKELRYRILERNVDTNQKMYDTLLSKIKEADVTGNLDVSNIRVAEDAQVPQKPVKPNIMLNLIISLLLGLASGIALAFIRDYLDRTIKTEEDVRNFLGLPVLSVVPVAKTSGIRLDGKGLDPDQEWPTE